TKFIVDFAMQELPRWQGLESEAIASAVRHWLAGLCDSREELIFIARLGSHVIAEASCTDGIAAEGWAFPLGTAPRLSASRLVSLSGPDARFIGIIEHQPTDPLPSGWVVARKGKVTYFHAEAAAWVRDIVRIRGRVSSYPSPVRER